MFPMVCFSCGRPISQLWSTYFHLVNLFFQQEKTKNPNLDLDYDSNAKYKALKELEIYDECCRRMFICQIEKVFDTII